MNKDKVYLKGYVIGRAADTLGYEGLMVQLENLDVVEIDKNLVHRDINGPQKVTVPQFVADWYEANKDDFEQRIFDLIYEIFKKRNDNELIDIEKWLIDENINQFQTLVNMHQFGYEVEKEKRYTVKIKAFLGQYLERYYLNNERLTPQFKRTQPTGSDKLPTFTRKELEQTGFGWVFDCPGMEVEEVE